MPVFDVRRRGLLYLTSRHLMSVDEPNMEISLKLERVLDRWERRDPTLKPIPQMSDEDRVKTVLDFIVSCAGEERDALLQRFAERPSIVFGWRPGALESLVDYDTPLYERYQAHLARACETAIELTIATHRLSTKPVFSVSL
ncbi:MAG: hypothetical protein ACXVEF_31550 [Polyangiales bacterium]